MRTICFRTICIPARPGSATNSFARRVLVGAGLAATASCALAQVILATQFSETGSAGPACATANPRPSAHDIVLSPAPWSGADHVEGYVGDEYRFSGRAGARVPLEHYYLHRSTAGDSYIELNSTEPNAQATVRFGTAQDCLVSGTLRFEARIDGTRANDALRVAAINFGVSRLLTESRHHELKADYAAAHESIAAAERLARMSDVTLAQRSHNLAHRVASVYWSEGRLDEAAEQGERALALMRQAPRVTERDWATTANDLGLTYRDLGRRDQAATVLADVHQRAERSLGPDDRLTITALYNLGLVHLDAGDYARAAPVLEATYAARVRTAGPSDVDTLRSREALSSIYSLTGRHAEAVALSEGTVELWKATMGDGHPFTEYSKAILARHLGLIGERKRAIALLEEAYTALKSRLGPLHSYTTLARHNLTIELFKDGNAKQAEPLVVESLELAERNADLRVRGLAQILLSDLRQHQGEWQQALDANSAGLALFERAQAWRRIADAYRKRADLLDAMGRRSEAVQALTRWMEAVERERTSIGFVEVQRQSLLASYLEGYRKLVAWQIDAGEFDSALSTSEKLKGRSLLDSLASRALFNAAGLDSAARDTLGALARKLAKYDDRLARENLDPQQRAVVEAERNADERQGAALRQELIAHSPRLRALTALEPVDAARARRALRTGTAAISYVFVADRLVAFVVRPERPFVVVSLGSTARVTAALDAFLALASSVGGADAVWRLQEGGFAVGPAPPSAARRVHDWREVAAELGALLLRPLTAHLGNAREIHVVPDGRLAELPFEAVLLDGKPLITRFTVSYVQSLSVLAAMQARPSRAAGPGRILLSMGAPDYGGASPDPAVETVGDELRRGLAQRPSTARRALARDDRTWMPLPGALVEVKSVARAFQSPALAPEAILTLTGADASESALQSLNRDGDLRKFRYLHFAAHGFLNPDTPSLSSIVLAQTEASADADGYVTAAEWAGYDIDSDLIVLSACESGRGTVLGGEGIMGLPYAMFVAGNRRAVMTLWRVVDSSSGELVTDFFQRVARGTPAPDALVRAKRKILANPRTRHPLHWAPFVIYGH